MKRPVTVTLLLLSALVTIPGCPIYDDDGCATDSQCAPGYICQLTTGECVEPYGPKPQCDEPRDCRPGATCDRYGQCRNADCSWSDVGCVDGYVCARDQGVWACVPEGSVTGTGGVSGSGGQSSGGGEGGGHAGSPGAGGDPGAGGEGGGSAGACDCSSAAGAGGNCSC
jgi:hypothetical protein